MTAGEVNGAVRLATESMSTANSAGSAAVEVGGAGTAAELKEALVRALELLGKLATETEVLPGYYQQGHENAEKAAGTFASTLDTDNARYDTVKAGAASAAERYEEHLGGALASKENLNAMQGALSELVGRAETVAGEFATRETESSETVSIGLHVVEEAEKIVF